MVFYNLNFVFLHTEEIPFPAVVIMIIIIAFVIKVNLSFGKRNTFKPRLYRKSELTESQKNILDRYCYYYYNMPTENLKQIFRKKVAYLIKVKRFIPAGGLISVSDEMKVLISASAIQLSFGYPRVFYSHFNTFVIFPREFRLNGSEQMYDGKVNLKGAVFLSWESFVNGYKIPDDGRNLGLHEMAHALYFENAFPNDEYDFINRRALLRFAIHTKNELIKIQNGGSVFFREYASKNRHKFFAVAVESFFERPNEFREYNEDLYVTLSVIINQDTCEANYSLRSFSA